MTKSKKITIAIILIAVISLTVYNIIIAITGGCTISTVIRSVAYKTPMIPFAIGVIIGHWLWGKTPEDLK